MKLCLLGLSSLVFGLSGVTTAQALSTFSEETRDRQTSNSAIAITDLAQLPTEPEADILSSEKKTIGKIEVRFVDKDGNYTSGATKPEVITREFDLKPGDFYDAELAARGLAGVRELNIVDEANLILEPTATADEAVMVVKVQENSSFFLDFGLTLEPPTALRGPVRPNVVNALSDRSLGTAGGIRLGLRNLGGTNQMVSLGIEGGEERLGFDVGYRNYLRHDRGYGINFFNQRGVEPEFDGGDRDVDLPSDNEPWVHRIGGGMEYFRSLARDFEGAVGISYQRVSVRERAFSDDIEAFDELGNRLTVSDDGQDDLLTINFAAVLDRKDEPRNPTSGFVLELGSDQSIPIGDANVTYNRLAASYTQYLPLDLFGFGEGARTLVLNFQGGTILGEIPPYNAYVLGGSSIVRGYGAGELGAGRSFVQTTAEYRYPLAAIALFDRDIDLGGTLFFDYASDLGTDDDVIGQPARVRDKPGSGFGYGLGIRALTPVGAVRLEFALNDEGDSEVIFKLGDRF